MPSIILALGAYLLIGIIVFYLIKAFHSLAPWIPSKLSMVRHALDAVHPSPGAHFVDLGCGDGRVVFFANRCYSLHAIGYEISPLPYVIAKLRQWTYRTSNVSIIRQDLYTAPLGNFDIIFAYGLPKTINEKLKPKLEKELKPGAYFISYNFSLSDKKPLMEFHEHWRNLFVYRF